VHFTEEYRLAFISTEAEQPTPPLLAADIGRASYTIRRYHFVNYIV
jgi:hypothetical protein